MAATVHGWTPKTVRPSSATGTRRMPQRFSSIRRRSKASSPATWVRSVAALRGRSHRPRVSSSNASGTSRPPSQGPWPGAIKPEVTTPPELMRQAVPPPRGTICAATTGGAGTWTLHPRAPAGHRGLGGRARIPVQAGTAGDRHDRSGPPAGPNRVTATRFSRDLMSLSHDPLDGPLHRPLDDHRGTPDGCLHARLLQRAEDGNRPEARSGLGGRHHQAADPRDHHADRQQRRRHDGPPEGHDHGQQHGRDGPRAAARTAR